MFKLNAEEKKALGRIKKDKDFDVIRKIYSHELEQQRKLLENDAMLLPTFTAKGRCQVLRASLKLFEKEQSDTPQGTR